MSRPNGHQIEHFYQKGLLCVQHDPLVLTCARCSAVVDLARVDVPTAPDLGMAIVDSDGSRHVCGRVVRTQRPCTYDPEPVLVMSPANAVRFKREMGAVLAHPEAFSGLLDFPAVAPQGGPAWMDSATWFRREQHRTAREANVIAESIGWTNQIVDLFRCSCGARCFWSPTEKDDAGNPLAMEGEWGYPPGEVRPHTCPMPKAEAAVVAAWQEALPSRQTRRRQAQARLPCPRVHLHRRRAHKPRHAHPAPLQEGRAP